MILVLPLLLAAASPIAPPSPTVAAPKTGARITAAVRAEILVAAEISFKSVAADKGKTDRQFAKRGDMPLIEFY